MSSLLHTRNSVAAAFALNGFCFATMVSRLPDIRSGLDLDNAALGLLLLAISVGSVIALPLSGRLIDRFSASAVTRFGAVLVAAGLTVAMAGVVTDLIALAAIGLFIDGVGIATWDVSMNVEAAEVERQLGRTIMPRFHAGWSFGAFAGALDRHPDGGSPRAADAARPGLRGRWPRWRPGARPRRTSPRRRSTPTSPPPAPGRRGASRARWPSGSW